MITSNSISAALPGPDRVKTQQVMAINCRGIFSVSRRPPGGRSGAIGMPLSASVRLLEGGKSRKNRPQAFIAAIRAPLPSKFITRLRL